MRVPSPLAVSELARAVLSSVVCRLSPPRLSITPRPSVTAAIPLSIRCDCFSLRFSLPGAAVAAWSSRAAVAADGAPGAVRASDLAAAPSCAIHKNNSRAERHSVENHAQGRATRQPQTRRSRSILAAPWAGSGSAAVQLRSPHEVCVALDMHLVRLNLVAGADQAPEPHLQVVQVVPQAAVKVGVWRAGGQEAGQRRPATGTAAPALARPALPRGAHLLVARATPCSGTSPHEGPSSGRCGRMRARPAGTRRARLPSPTSTRLRWRYMCSVDSEDRLWSSRPPSAPARGRQRQHALGMLPRRGSAVHQARHARR